jgi:hypothetical protein
MQSLTEHPETAWVHFVLFGKTNVRLSAEELKKLV